MPLIVVLPSLSILVSVIAVSWAFRQLGSELSRLRPALRRMTVTAVAVDELDREATAMGARASRTALDARQRLQRPLPRNKPLAR